MGDHHHHQQQGRNGDANGLELPPGFRFHPSDEELIICYLRPKVFDHNFTALAIGEADLNKSEPWELPLMANMGEKEWYFYCQNDRKYPTGVRANRATEAGYWKATGKDREIYDGESIEPVLIGMKKTLVFYKGRAPKGVKTNWVMHEYRLPYHRVWVVCRVFQKCSGIEQTPELPPASTPELPPTSESTYHMTIGGDNSVDLRSMSFPMPTKLPMEPEDFTMDFSASSYPSVGMSSVLPALSSPMVGMGFQMNTGHFWGHDGHDSTDVVLPATEDWNIRQLSRPTSMLSDEVRRVSPEQTNVVKFSSTATAEPVITPTANMDSIWKY